MLRYLKAWRRQYMPTDREKFADGVAYVEEELDRVHPHMGMEVLKKLPLNKRDPFDRGIFHAIRLYQEQYDHGYNEAEAILRDKPGVLAFPLISAMINAGGHRGRGALHAVEKKERVF